MLVRGSRRLLPILLGDLSRFTVLCRRAIDTIGGNLSRAILSEFPQVTIDI